MSDLNPNKWKKLKDGSLIKGVNQIFVEVINRIVGSRPPKIKLMGKWVSSDAYPNAIRDYSPYHDTRDLLFPKWTYDYQYQSQVWYYPKRKKFEISQIKCFDDLRYCSLGIDYDYTPVRVFDFGTYKSIAHAKIACDSGALGLIQFRQNNIDIP